MPSPLWLEPTDGGGDPALLQLIVPPEGYIAATDQDEDEDGIVCADCASPEEIADHMARLAELGEIMQTIYNDEEHGDDGPLL
jgi:hypothetical protein